MANTKNRIRPLVEAQFEDDPVSMRESPFFRHCISQRYLADEAGDNPDKPSVFLEPDQAWPMLLQAIATPYEIAIQENPIEQIVAEVTAQLQFLKSQIVISQDGTKSAVRVLHQIIEMTTRLFGEDIRVFEDFDPEYPADVRFTVFSVKCEMDVDAILDAEEKWIKELSQIVPQCNSIRLTVNTRE